MAQGFETIGQSITTPTAGLFFKYQSPDLQSYWKQFNDDPHDGEGLQANLRRVGYIDGKYNDT